MDKLGAFLIAALTLGIYGFLSWMYFTGNVVQTADSAAVIGGILNTTAGWAGLGVGYFVGSSAGSASKDKTISSMAQGTGNGTNNAAPDVAAKV